MTITDLIHKIGEIPLVFVPVIILVILGLCLCIVAIVGGMK